MKIEIEQAPDTYVIELMKDGELDTVLGTRESYKDAKADARWYGENEYPEAELEIPKFAWLDLQLNKIKYDGKGFVTRGKAVDQLISTMENNNRYTRNVIKDIDSLDRQITELEEFEFKLIEL